MAAGPELERTYAERNAAALAFAALALDAGWPVGYIEDPTEPDWPVLAVETPRGQVTWHLQQSEVPDWLRPHAHPWDGHTTPEKNRRLARLVYGGDVNDGAQ